MIALKKGTDATMSAPRMYTNFRVLNDITVKDTHPISRINNILAMIKDSTGVYSTLDLTFRYYQMGLTPHVIKRAVFVTPDGYWKYTWMLFGLYNMSASF